MSLILPLKLAVQFDLVITKRDTVVSKVVVGEWMSDHTFVTFGRLRCEATERWQCKKLSLNAFE
jgi:hypothetical protein